MARLFLALREDGFSILMVDIARMDSHACGEPVLFEDRPPGARWTKDTEPWYEHLGQWVILVSALLLVERAGWFERSLIPCYVHCTYKRAIQFSTDNLCIHQVPPLYIHIKYHMPITVAIPWCMRTMDTRWAAAQQLQLILHPANPNTPSPLLRA